MKMNSLLTLVTASFVVGMMLFCGCGKDDDIDIRNSNWVMYCGDQEAGAAGICDLFLPDSVKSEHYMDAYKIRASENSLSRYRLGFCRDTNGGLMPGFYWQEVVASGELLITDRYVALTTAGVKEILFYYQMSDDKLRVYSNDTVTGPMYAAPFEFIFRHVKDFPANGPLVRECP